MRVVAGVHRGRRLEAPPGTVTRPTSDKVRQATFNSLESAGLVDGAVVVDLFAGSGALGIEALSRGASTCTFVERERTALAALRRNLDHLGLGATARVVVADAMSWIATMDPVDLVLADPPYRFDHWAELLGRVRADVVVAESDHELEAPAGWEVQRARRYGRTAVTIFARIA